VHASQPETVTDRITRVSTVMDEMFECDCRLPMGHQCTTSSARLVRELKNKELLVAASWSETCCIRDQESVDVCRRLRRGWCWLDKKMVYF